MKDLAVKPLADRIIVQPDPPEELTEGGLLIPEKAREKPLRGTIVAIGTGTNDEMMVLKNGQRILFGKFSGVPITVGDEEFLIMKQSDALALLEE